MHKKNSKNDAVPTHHHIFYGLRAKYEEEKHKNKDIWPEYVVVSGILMAPKLGKGLGKEYTRRSPRLKLHWAWVSMPQFFKPSCLLLKLSTTVQAKINKNIPTVEQLFNPTVVIQKRCGTAVRLGLDWRGNNRITLIWIPVHTGLSDNQKADLLAKKGQEQNSWCQNL